MTLLWRLQATAFKDATSFKASPEVNLTAIDSPVVFEVLWERPKNTARPPCPVRSLRGTGDTKSWLAGQITLTTKPIETRTR